MGEQICGVKLTLLKRHGDERGWLCEAWRNDWTEICGYEYEPAMAYVSSTNKGVVRGPHEHKWQTDAFVFLGRFRVRLWDARSSCLTFGRVMDFAVEGPAMLVVPPGVVHAYAALEDNALCLNLPDKLYAGPGKAEPVDEVRHEKDPDSPYEVEDMRGAR